MLRGAYPLSLAELQDIQAESMADDLEIDLERMSLWTEEQAREYFESGGEEVPDVPTEAALRAGSFRRDDWSYWLSPLGAVGTGPKLVGEALDERRRCYAPKPLARVRLFCLYGVADVSLSMQPWMLEAPAWLEVRLLELPGHGLRKEEEIPGSSIVGPLDEADFIAHRAALVNSLADEVGRAAGDEPYALYGFSYGAILMYELARELISRASASAAAAAQLLCLCAGGRGAPHCFGLSRAAAARYVAGGTDEVLDMQAGLGFASNTVPPSMRPRAAALFRSGMLLGMLPPGETRLREGVGFDGSEFAQHEFAEQVPMLPESCAVLAITSEGDYVWVAELSARWRDVSPPGGSFREVFVQSGVGHDKLMNHAETMEAVFGEVAVAAQRLAWRRKSGAPP